MTYLMVAASKGNIDVVNLLLNDGADPKVINHVGVGCVMRWCVL